MELNRASREEYLRKERERTEKLIRKQELSNCIRQKVREFDDHQQQLKLRMKQQAYEDYLAHSTMQHLIAQQEQKSQEMQRYNLKFDQQGHYHFSKFIHSEQNPKGVKSYNRGKSIPSESDFVSHIPSVNQSFDFKESIERQFRQKKAETSFDIHNDTPSLLREQIANSPMVMPHKFKEVAQSHLILKQNLKNRKIREISMESKSVVSRSIVHESKNEFKSNFKNSLSPKAIQSTALSRKLSAEELQSYGRKNVEMMNVLNSIEGLKKNLINYKLIMDDEASYPAINLDTFRKIPPFSLKEAAERDQEQERSNKRKMKALMNLGIINERGEVGNGFRLPAINGDKQVRVSRLSSPYNSPSNWRLIVGRSDDKSRKSPDPIIETEPLPLNHKKVLPRNLVSKSPPGREFKGTLQITEKDLVEIEKSEDLIRRVKQWQGVTIDEDYLKERKVAQRKVEYWKRRIKKDFVPQTQSLRKLNEEAKKEKKKLNEMEALFTKKFNNTKPEPDLVITLQ